METLSFFSGRKITGIIKNKIMDLPKTANIQFCELLVNDSGIVTNRVDIYLHTTKSKAKFYFIINPF